MVCACWARKGEMGVGTGSREKSLRALCASVATREGSALWNAKKAKKPPPLQTIHTAGAWRYSVCVFSELLRVCVQHSSGFHYAHSWVRWFDP